MSEYLRQLLDAAWCDYRDAALDYDRLPHNAPPRMRERLRKRRDVLIEKMREAETRIAEAERSRGE